MQWYHFAKVIATMWPAIEKETVLKRLINFVDIFRINFSHWGLQNAKRYVDIIRKIDTSKAIMFDTRWPEVRIKNEKGIDITKKKKVKFIFSETFVDNDEFILIDYPFLTEVPKGVLISIDDNKIILRVEKIESDWFVAKVIVWGFIKSNKSINFKDYTPKLDFLTDEDKQWILWAIKNHIVFIAVSFVKTWEDIKFLRDFLNKNWWDYIKIVAKIETVEALKNIDEILVYSDAIMIARWDLGGVIPLEQLSKIQLQLINKANRYWKPVIVATQVMPTMVSNPVPSRAEVDEIVFNIKNWVDAFMVSDETAVGQYPYQTLEWLNKIIDSNYEVVDLNLKYEDLFVKSDYQITDHIIYEAWKLSEEMDIKAIICPTETGYTPARLSTLKPKVPIIAFTRSDDTFKYLNLLWGVKWYRISDWFGYERIKTLWKEIVRILLKWNVNIDDKILIVHSSIAQNVPWMINWLEVYKFKDL